MSWIYFSAASQYQKKEKKKQMKPIYNINGYKSWKADDKNRPGFPRDFQIAKFAVFRAQVSGLLQVRHS